MALLAFAPELLAVTEQYIKAGNPDPNDHFGRSVAISGGIAAVGSPNEDGGYAGVTGTPDNSVINSGVVYIYGHNGSAWQQQTYLKPDDLSPDAVFGRSVAISGDTLVVGAPGKGDAGAAYVFVRCGNSWMQQAFLRGGNSLPGDTFGTAVAISGDTIVVGAPLEDGGPTTGPTNTPAYASGAAYVFRRSGTNWTEEAYLKSFHMQPSAMLFGTSVGISGDTIIVGAPSERSSSTGINSTPNQSAVAAGAAFVFKRTQTLKTTWTPQAYLKPNDTQPSSAFGIAVGISGDTAAVGAESKAAVYVFQRTGDTWAQQAKITRYIRFGQSLQICGDKLLAASTHEAWLYSRSNSVWTAQAGFTRNYEPQDGSGIMVSFSGDSVIVGSRLASGSANNAYDKSIQYSGAAYIYDFAPPPAPAPTAPSAGFNQLSGQLLGNGTHRLTFSGTPDANYALESTTSLVSPQWTPQLTNQASPEGTLVFTTESNAPQIFYRVRLAP